MKIKCIVIDDEPLAAELIVDFIAKIPQLELVAQYANAIDSLQTVQAKEIDLIFLDIQMPLITGMEFLRSMKNPPKVIFTTAYREYAVESYELDVVDYLLKPISFDRFLSAVSKVLYTTPTTLNTTEVQKNAQDFIYINVNKKHHKILHDDILYIESIKDYVKVHTHQKSLSTKQKISTIIDALPDYFLRVHRSYIVNVNKISAFTTQDVEIGKIEIPIGSSYKQIVNAVLKA